LGGGGVKVEIFRYRGERKPLDGEDVLRRKEKCKTKDAEMKHHFEKLSCREFPVRNSLRKERNGVKRFEGKNGQHPLDKKLVRKKGGIPLL